MDAVQIDLANRSDSPARARRAVAELVGNRPRTDELLLCVSEVVTNAVLHGAEPIEVYVCSDGDLLRIEVSDGGPRTDGVVPRSAEDSRPGGRGLHIVNSLADRWGTTDKDAGKTVWAEIGLTDDNA